MALQAPISYQALPGLVPDSVQCQYKAAEKIWARCHHGFTAILGSPPSKAQRLQLAKFIVLAWDHGVWSTVVWPALSGSAMVGPSLDHFYHSIKAYTALIKVLKEFGPVHFYTSKIGKILTAAFENISPHPMGDDLTYSILMSEWTDKLYSVWYELFTWSNAQWAMMTLETVLENAKTFGKCMKRLMRDLLNMLIANPPPSDGSWRPTSIDLIIQVTTALLHNHVLYFFDHRVEGRHRTNISQRLLFSKMATAHSVAAALNEALVKTYRPGAAEDSEDGMVLASTTFFGRTTRPNNALRFTVKIDPKTLYYWHPKTLLILKSVGQDTRAWNLELEDGRCLQDHVLQDSLWLEWEAWSLAIIDNDLFNDMRSEFREFQRNNVGIEPLPRVLNAVERGAVSADVPAEVAWLQDPEFFPPPEPAAASQNRPVGPPGSPEEAKVPEPQVHALEAPHEFSIDDVENLLDEAWCEIAEGYRDAAGDTDLIQMCPVVVRLHDGRVSSHVYELESIKTWVTSQVNDQRRRFPNRTPVVRDPLRDGDIDHSHPDGWYFQPHTVWRSFNALVKALKAAKRNSEQLQQATGESKDREEPAGQEASEASPDDEPDSQTSRKRQRVVPPSDFPQVKLEKVAIDLTGTE